MRIVFWQNCLSPHQLPYIARLMEDKRVTEVVVVAGEEVNTERREMGWELPSYPGIEKCQVFVAPEISVIKQLMENESKDSWHLFSGIRADAFVFKCLKVSMEYDVKRGIITERPNTYDFKHGISNAKPYWMHRLRFMLQDRGYAKHIHVVFAMGQEAVRYYESLCMKWRVFPFCYCTQPATGGAKPHLADRLPQYLYCGSLSAWKDPVAIARGLSRLKLSSKEKVRMIGDGPLRAKLEEYVSKNHLADKIQLLGTKPQTEVPIYMQQSDIFILPSLYDGWGAVVNEALQAGCYVICSDAAGASDLIKMEKRLGIVFKHADICQLANCISWCNEHIDDVRTDRDFRVRWADEHISGRAVAHYMVDCLSEL